VKDDAGAGKTRGILPTQADTLGATPPDGAVVLLAKDGEHSSWKNERTPPTPIRWLVENDTLIIVPESGSLVTKDSYGDFRLHLEFRVPKDDSAEGNSGIYIERRYELQILDSETGAKPHARCGAIYRYRAPTSEAARAAGEWQAFDIVFRTTRWEDQNKVQNARVTAHLNGELVHDDVPIPSPTGAGRDESPEPAPLKLQDHGSPVAFRNIWLIPLELD
jgi:hypothetical protein